ncbi:MAG: hypothetical protein IJ802_06980 [Kiritimatiellae bacterium]|nr:hypothetical protein [Kiritimatiellia bacterium]
MKLRDDLPYGAMFFWGEVRVFRNSAGRKFKDGDEFEFTEKWHTPARIMQAYAKAAKRANEQEAKTVFAWNERFGYLSPMPEHIGCGIEVVASLFAAGLGLLGHFGQTVNAFQARRFTVATLDVEGWDNVAHYMDVRTCASLGKTSENFLMETKTFLAEVARQEAAARAKLFGTNKIILADAAARSLAILKAAKMMSPWEAVDLLAPLYLLALENSLSGIAFEDVMDMMLKPIAKGVFRRDPETPEDDRRRDEEDAVFASEMNRIFENVRINKRGERMLYG